MEFTVIIPTYNRADELQETIRSLAGLVVNGPWELIVADNRSTDQTRAVVEAARSFFPAEIRYLYEAEQGRYAALNTAIRAARGAIIATTDDDARVEPDWLETAAAGLRRFDCDYVGGKVLPLWRGPRPEWIPDQRGPHWAVLAMADYGEQPKEFGVAGVPWPLGINTATRAEAFRRIELFDNRLGRKAGTLRNQAQREWHLRAKAAGLRGFYIPAMVVHHVVEQERLTKQYFRRWYYWHGISRAILFAKLGVDMDSPDQSTLDFSTVPQIAGVPRFMYRTLLTRMRDLVKARVRGNSAEAFQHEIWLCFFAGLAKQRWTDRAAPIPANPPESRFRNRETVAEPDSSSASLDQRSVKSR